MRKLTACALQRKGIHQQEMVGVIFLLPTGVRIRSLPLELINNMLNKN